MLALHPGTPGSKEQGQDANDFQHPLLLITTSVASSARRGESGKSGIHEGWLHRGQFLSEPHTSLPLPLRACRKQWGAPSETVQGDLPHGFRSCL